MWWVVFVLAMLALLYAMIFGMGLLITWGDVHETLHLSGLAYVYMLGALAISGLIALGTYISIMLILGWAQNG